MPLTDTTIRNAKPGPKPRRLADGGGLTLSIRPNATKAWRLRYRFRGTEQQISLGIYPDVGLQQARQLRDECRQLLAGGVNPSAARKAKHAASMDNTTDTFETVAREFYKSRLPNWEPGTSSMILMRLEKYVFPKIGRQSITDVGAQDILSMLKPIQAQSKFETASRCLRVTGQVLNYARATGRRTDNPADAVRPALTKPKPKHFAAVTDPKETGKLLLMIESYRASPAVMAALKLAPLWFVRPGELRRAKWADMKLDASEPQWEFLATKTRTPHIVPLARQAVEILRALRPVTGHQEWVFPGQRHNGRVMSENTLAVAMRTIGIPKEKMSVHGWRAAAMTLLDEQLHFPPNLVKHQLAHRVADALGRAYNRTTHLTERRRMMQDWANWLDELRGDAT